MQADELQCQMTAMRAVAHLLAAKRASPSQVPHRALVEVAGLENGKALCGAINAAKLSIGNRVSCVHHCTAWGELSCSPSYSNPHL